MIICLCSVALAGAQNIYIAVGGSDGGTGTEAEPLKSVQVAIDKAVSGDTIVLRAGEYDIYKAVEIVRKPTTELMPIIITNQENENVVLDFHGSSFAFLLEFQSNIIFKGITIKNANEGIYVQGGAKNIVIDSCVISNIGRRGVFFRCFND